MLKILFLLSFIVCISVLPAYGQTVDFGYQLHPQKLLEFTEGTLQVYVSSNDVMLPKVIENLEVTSSDNKIIKILEVLGKEKNIIEVKIKAENPGKVNIALAAPGFFSREIPLEVFNSNNYPTQILMKVTPNDFAVDGQRFGYVAVELATTGELPTKALEDTVVRISTPNSDIISLENSELIIDSGKYYAIGKFNIKGSGDAIIFADVDGMQKISELVHIRDPEKPLKVKLYVYPRNFNSFSSTNGYAVVELLDASDIPVKAEKDIHIAFEAENPDSGLNTSTDFKEVFFDSEKVVIKEGTYSAYTKFSLRPNLSDFTAEDEQTFNVFISTEDYLVEGDKFTITHEKDAGAIEGQGPAVIRSLPFLTTGDKEIVAIIYLETDIEVSKQTGGSTLGTTNREIVSVTSPVAANDDFKMRVASSDLDTVKTQDVFFKKGENVALVFGETGTVLSGDILEYYVTDNEGVKDVKGKAYGPLEEDLSLKVESLIPKILAENTFPLIGYLFEEKEEEESSSSSEEEEEDGRLGPTYFVKDTVLTFSANEFIEIEPEIVKQNQPYALTFANSAKVGTTVLSAQASGLDYDTEIISYTTEPTKIHLSYLKNILAESQTFATVQLLDSADNPVYAKKNIEIKLVSNDESTINVPNRIIINEGEYFASFNLQTINEGTVELALLAEDLPLTRHEINVIDIKPELTLNVVESSNFNERVEATLKMSFPKIDVPLDGFSVEWNVSGGEVKQMSEITDSEGKAVMNVIGNDKDIVRIEAMISGYGFPESAIVKSVKIIKPITEDTEIVPSNNQDKEFSFDYSYLLLVAIPIVIVAIIFFLKRTDRLGGITERLDLEEKVESIKDKVSELRDR